MKIDNMITHTLILQCQRKNLVNPLQFRSFIVNELKQPKLHYFGRNGNKVFESKPALMEHLRDTVYVKLSFQHLLKLQPEHSFAVVEEALKRGFITDFSYDDNQMSVQLH